VLRGDFPVIVDAADSPARVATLLDSLREAGVGRIFTVLGCDGETTSKTMRTQVRDGGWCWVEGGLRVLKTRGL